MTDINIIKSQVEQVADAIRDISAKVEKGSATMLDKAELAKFEEKFNARMDEVEAIKASLNAPKVESKADQADIEHKEAFEAFIRKGREEGLIDLQVKALSVGTDTDGGYTVPKDVLSLIKTRVYESSPIRQYATVETISTNAFEDVIDNSEAGAEWVGETSARNETATPTLGKKIIPAHEIQASPQATQQLLDDSAFNMEQWLSGKVAEKFIRTQNNAFINGNGVAKPTGILNSVTASKALTAADAYSASQVEVYKTGSAGSFSADNLLDLIGKLKVEYKQNAIMFGGRAARTALVKLKDGDNRYLFSFSANGELLIDGVPFVAFNDMPTVATDAIALGVGDLKSAYKIVDRAGVRVLRDPYTSKPFVKFYTTARVGGDVVNYEAIKLLKLEA